MRFHLGPPPVDPSFDPQLPWQPLREPKRIASVIALSLPLGMLAALGYLVVALALEPAHTTVLALDLQILFAFVFLIPLHELLHALAVPGPLRSQRLVVGIWSRAFLAYVHYTGVLRRERWLIVALCPLVTLSVLCLALAQALPAWKTFWLTVGALNALASGGDLLGALLVLTHVPRQAWVRNHGWYTYWRPATDDQLS